MYKFALYLSKSFLFIWLSTVFGFLVLIGLLDSLANGGLEIAGAGRDFIKAAQHHDRARLGGQLRRIRIILYTGLRRLLVRHALLHLDRLRQDRRAKAKR